MKRLIPLLALALLLTGCATFNDRELAQVRSRGVSPTVLAKLDRGGPLSIDEVIQLSRRRVPETWIIRQLDDHGVESLVTRSDVKRLRKAGVHPAVVDAVVRASDDFADSLRQPQVAYWGFGGPSLGFYDPWWPYGGFGAGFATFGPGLGGPFWGGPWGGGWGGRGRFHCR